MRTRIVLSVGLSVGVSLGFAGCGGAQPPSSPSGSGAGGGEAHPHGHDEGGREAHPHGHDEGGGEAHPHGHGEGGGAGDDHAHRAAHADHSFEDVDRYEQMFDDPARDAWQRPAEVVALLALSPGQTAVDLGAGTGYFVPHLAPAVQPGGQVLALDAEPAMVTHLEERIAREGIAGAAARVVAPDDPGLATASVDRVLTVNTWHHIHDRVAYARKLRQALRPGGFVLVVDFTHESPHGPPREARIEPAAVVEELRAAGLEAEIVPETLPHQYAVRGTRR